MPTFNSEKPSISSPIGEHTSTLKVSMCSPHMEEFNATFKMGISSPDIGEHMPTFIYNL